MVALLILANNLLAATPQVTGGAAAPGKQPSTARAVDGLEPALSRFEVLGMQFRPPAGSIMRGEGSGRTATWVISEDADSPKYILRASKLYADGPSDPSAQIDDLVRSVSERPSANTVFAVRSRKEFMHKGQPAALLYTSLREGEGEEEVSAVQGYFLVQVAPAEFVVISSLVAERDFPAVEPLLGRSFGTVEVLDPEALARDRADRMGRGERLLAALDEAALRRAAARAGNGRRRRRRRRRLAATRARSTRHDARPAPATAGTTAALARAPARAQRPDLGQL